MKWAIASVLVVAWIVGNSRVAGAQDEGPEERYFTGPGGGEVASDAGDGTPPLESTGLEEGIGGGCDCSVTGRSVTPLAGLPWLAVASIIAARRRHRRVVAS
jgi:hypothetical protein